MKNIISLPDLFWEKSKEFNSMKTYDYKEPCPFDIKTDWIKSINPIYDKWGITNVKRCTENPIISLQYNNQSYKIYERVRRDDFGDFMFTLKKSNNNDTNYTKYEYQSDSVKDILYINMNGYEGCGCNYKVKSIYRIKTKEVEYLTNAIIQTPEYQRIENIFLDKSKTHKDYYKSTVNINGKDVNMEFRCIQQGLNKYSIVVSIKWSILRLLSFSIQEINLGDK